MTFPCALCNRCTARTNGGALFCLDCRGLPEEKRRAALERRLACPVTLTVDEAQEYQPGDEHERPAA